jgi:hypothetical protein
VSAAGRTGHASPAQIAAARRNLIAARAAIKARHVRSPAQVAASRRNLAIARSAQKARRSGKAPVAAKKPQAPLPGTWTADGLDPGWADLLSLPACGPVALAEHLLAWTGTAASPAAIIELWELAGAVTLGGLFEAASEYGLGGQRLARFGRCDPDSVVPGLIYGVILGGRYHAALAAPGGMITWCRMLPRDGTPDEAWHLEWEDC